MITDSSNKAVGINFVRGTEGIKESAQLVAMIDTPIRFNLIKNKENNELYN